jgi:cytochrome bd-type quinol oxidase subunit 2
VNGVELDLDDVNGVELDDLLDAFAIFLALCVLEFAQLSMNTGFVCETSEKVKGNVYRIGIGGI